MEAEANIMAIQEKYAQQPRVAASIMAIQGIPDQQQRPAKQPRKRTNSRASEDV